MLNFESGYAEKTQELFQRVNCRLKSLKNATCKIISVINKHNNDQQKKPHKSFGYTDKKKEHTAPKNLMKLI